MSFASDRKMPARSEDPEGERLFRTTSNTSRDGERPLERNRAGHDNRSAHEKLAAALAATAPKKKVIPPSATAASTSNKNGSPGLSASPGTKGGKTSSSGNPLDALAFACLAEEEKSDIQEGALVRADDVSCNDVLCGRGGQSNHHAGNIFFRRLVRAKQEEYLKANKKEKTLVAKDIVKLVRMLTPQGRFLKKDTHDDDMFVEVGDVQARNKASQALREGAPELREELRDIHSRMGGLEDGSEMRLPYHGAGKGGRSDPTGDSSDEEFHSHSRNEEELRAAAAAQGMHLSAYGGMDSLLPPEERARRLMYAAATGAPGGAYSHFGLGGYGGGGGGGPGLHQYYGGGPAAMSGGGGAHLISPHALMLAGLHPHQQPSQAAMLQANRARELAAGHHAYGGMNPYLRGAQNRGPQNRGAPQPKPQDPPHSAHLQEQAFRLHELVHTSGNHKRERDEGNYRISEEKATKLSRRYL